MLVLVCQKILSLLAVFETIMMIFFPFQISNNLDFKKRVLQTHFLEHPGKTRPMRSWKTSIDIDPEAPWILQEKSSWNYHQKQVSS